MKPYNTEKREERLGDIGPEASYQFQSQHNSKSPHRVDMSQPSESHKALRRSNTPSNWAQRFNEHEDKINSLYDKLNGMSDLGLYEYKEGSNDLSNRLKPEASKIIDEILYNAGRAASAEASDLFDRDLYHDKTQEGYAPSYTGYEDEDKYDLAQMYSDLLRHKDGRFYTPNMKALVDRISMERELKKRGYTDEQLERLGYMSPNDEYADRMLQEGLTEVGKPGKDDGYTFYK